MSNTFDVKIYLRNISLEVAIPEKYVWEFMSEFGYTFAEEDAIGGGKRTKKVDSYYDHPNGWHIQVSVWERDEARFYEFLRYFCTVRQLTFREPGDTSTA